METVIKGSPEWRTIFFGNDVDDFMGKSSAFERLFYCGDLSALLDQDRPKILITGIRDIGPEEKEVIRRILGTISLNPLRPVIISGLAIGTDTAVHEAALRLGLATVAVLPTGLDSVYPNCNRGLANRIGSTPGCALITQFPQKTEPTPINFLLRSKTMAMISDFAVIPYCRAKGSAINIAKLMNDLSRDTFAVAGPPGETRSEGCNNLIAQGIAEIYTEKYTEPFLKGKQEFKNQI